jgi:O-antigen/teichoic acid export membrane protein
MRIDLFFIGYFLPAEQLGLYFLASSLTEVVDRMIVPLGQVLFSFVSGLDFRRAASLINTAFRVFLIGSIFAFIAFIPMVFYGIPLIFGSDYKSAAILLIILFPSAVARILIRTLYAFFMAQNIHENAVIAYLAALLSLCVLDIILIPKIGIVGAALGLSTAYGIGLTMMICQYRSFTQISYTNLWRITSSDFKRFKDVLVKARSGS